MKNETELNQPPCSTSEIPIGSHWMWECGVAEEMVVVEEVGSGFVTYRDQRGDRAAEEIEIFTRDFKRVSNT